MSPFLESLGIHSAPVNPCLEFLGIPRAPIDPFLEFLGIHSAPVDPFLGIPRDLLSETVLGVRQIPKYGRSSSRHGDFDIHPFFEDVLSAPKK